MARRNVYHVTGPGITTTTTKSANKFCARIVKVLSKLFNGTSCLEPILLLRLPLKHRCSPQPADRCLFISRRAHRSPRSGRAAAAQRPQLLPPASERLPGQGERGARPHRRSLQSLSPAELVPSSAAPGASASELLRVSSPGSDGLGTATAGHKPAVYLSHPNILLQFLYYAGANALFQDAYCTKSTYFSEYFTVTQRDWTFLFF